MSWLSAALFSTLLLLFAACGGGSTGTGGTGSEFSGKLVDITGKPVQNATLTIEETGDGSLTDAEGNFVIESDIPAGSVTLLVQAENSEGKTVMKDIPTGRQQVILNLRFNARDHTVEITDRVVKPRPKPTAKPRPTSTPRPSRTSIPSTPVPVDTPLPTAVPVEPTVVPTSPPTATPVPVVEFTIFRGQVDSSDAAQLAGATIAIRGKGQHAINADGSFEFGAKLFEPAKILVIRAGDRVGRIALPTVTNTTKRVTLSLAIAADSKHGLDIVLNSIVLLQRSESSPATDLPLENPEALGEPTPSSTEN